MVRIDNAEIIRQMAYEIWQREGCPSGREHEHWAEANRVFAARHPQKPSSPAKVRPAWDAGEAERNEIEAMRSALWTPEAYSPELFGRGSWSEIRTPQVNAAGAAPTARRFQRNTKPLPRNAGGHDRHRPATRG